MAGRLDDQVTVLSLALVGKTVAVSVALFSVSRSSDVGAILTEAGCTVLSDAFVLVLSFHV